MARSRPLYTIWSRGQMTASRMFTSVTTATSITRTFNFRNITVELDERGCFRPTVANGAVQTGYNPDTTN